MKWLGWVITILTGILLIMLVFLMPRFAFLVGIYGGLLAYWNFRGDWRERWIAIKKIGVSGILITALLLIEIIIIRRTIESAIETYPLFYAMMPSFYHAIIPGFLFVAIPVLLAFLEGLTPPDAEGLKRNPFFVLMLVILTFGVYVIYWFWLTKKGLRKNNIETRTLWWFLLPIIGWIIVYVSFSKGLEKRTKVSFWAWFLVFFFVSSLDVVISQAIINHSLKKAQEDKRNA